MDAIERAILDRFDISSEMVDDIIREAVKAQIRSLVKAAVKADPISQTLQLKVNDYYKYVAEKMAREIEEEMEGEQAFRED